MLTTTLSYRLLAKDLQRSLGTVAAEPQVARATQYYEEKIADVKSIDDFFADDRLYSYAMKAFGLSEMTFAKAFMRKVLSEGIDSQTSFANSLSDPRYREIAAAFNFARYDSTTTAFERTRSGTVDRYHRQTLEENAGRENEGVRLALYFERKAKGLGSALDILADRALLRVVQVALGIPAVSSSAGIDRQARAIDSRLDLNDLKDPQKLDSFLNRFTSLWEIENPAAPPTVPSILLSRPIGLGIGSELLASIQNIKFRGR